MFGSSNDFFKRYVMETEEDARLRLSKKKEVMIRLLRIRKFKDFEIKDFETAYNYFVIHPLAFDGATLVKDIYDIPKLELSAMLHDYQYICLLSNSKSFFDWLEKKRTFDKEYRNNLIRLNKSKRKVNKNLIYVRAYIRYFLLKISTIPYILYKGF